jgi:hypothetical protein
MGTLFQLHMQTNATILSMLIIPSIFISQFLTPTEACNTALVVAFNPGLPPAAEVGIFDARGTVIGVEIMTKGVPEIRVVEPAISGRFELTGTVRALERTTSNVPETIPVPPNKLSMAWLIGMVVALLTMIWVLPLSTTVLPNIVLNGLKGIVVELAITMTWLPDMVVGRRMGVAPIMEAISEAIAPFADCWGGTAFPGEVLGI